LRADGTEHHLRLEVDPAPAVPGPELVVIDRARYEGEGSRYRRRTQRRPHTRQPGRRNRRQNTGPDHGLTHSTCSQALRSRGGSIISWNQSAPTRINARQR
jgi:hypothetical protein